MNRKYCYSHWVLAIVMIFQTGFALARDVDWAALNPEINGATFINKSSECNECHEEHIRTFAMTKHGRSLPQGGCESCHGPGSMYKGASVMKNRELAMSKGMIIPDESTCKGCHNEGSPTYKGFNFAEASAKIAHPNPSK